MVITDKTKSKDPKPKLRRSFRTPESGVLLLAVLSLVVLFNPFSEEVRALAPALSFLAIFALFMVPGLVLALALLGPNLVGLARVPAAFVLSVGVFGLAALPELVLDQSLFFYPVICRDILILSLELAVVRIVLRGRTSTEDHGRRFEIDLSTVLLWVPFSLLAGVLAWLSAANVPGPAEDVWVYLSNVRELEMRLGGGTPSRLLVNGWLPEQSMLSSFSGLDLVTLVLQYLAPTLVVVALLALYALARTLLKNEKAALAVGSLSALFFLLGFGSSYFHSVVAPGREFVAHIVEDKFVARYVFLPIALSLAVVFVRERSWRNLGLFFFVCVSVAIVHPLGLVFIGLSLAGFGLIHLAINWRDRGAWRGIGGLWLTLLLLTGPPALYLLATGNPVLLRPDATDPGTAANLISTWQYERRLLEIGQGSYVMHPSLLLDPAMLGVYLLGIPFLIWKIKRAKDVLAAQLLLGTLVFVPLITFVPYTATFISKTIGPWLLYRLAWPLLLAGLLTLGWICWEVLRFVGSVLGTISSAQRVAPFLPLIVVVFLLVDAVPIVLSDLRAADDPDKIAQDDSSCLDPTFPWLKSIIPSSRRNSVGIMAPRAENSCMKAYVVSADVLGGRGQESSQQDLEDFYAAPTLGPEALQILQRHDIQYVMLPTKSPLNVQLNHLPGFTKVNNPGERYRMYEVTDQQQAFEPTPVILANADLNDKKWDAAIAAYTEALKNDLDENDQFLAYLGLGGAYTQKNLYAKAAQNYEAALKLDPGSSTAHDLLAGVRNASGENSQAQTEFERAIEIDPNNVDLRLRYGQFLIPLDQSKAIEQYQVVTESYPKVPDYRVKLGATLLLVGVPQPADEQFQRAVDLSPYSARLWADIGEANLLTGYPLKALGYYKEALRLDPNSQLYALNLGKAHAQLSTVNGGRDEEHFKEAEALFERVQDLSHLPWEADQREAARIALGDLYLAWDRPEDAAAAYEQALELDPDSKEAQEKLDKIQQ